ncbi:hypothetical protein HPB47_026254 [Ixodes persulcatus]|uniref:Uncharacterized protein n=1 Tax=Ixodes persulcatus TaxID=34615 RepID=A0AC60PZA1_IXOPE|nr:hypothetical protein HPB47_026254 [Ixodes persulcatus]
MVLPVLVYVVEPHHHALHHFYRTIGRKKLPFSKVLMVHFDAHPDLVLPPGLDPARCRDQDHVLNVVDIESCRLPSQGTSTVCSGCTVSVVGSAARRRSTVPHRLQSTVKAVKIRGVWWRHGAVDVCNFG